VEQVRLDMKDFSFLYEQGDALVFMDTESYEQLELRRISSVTARPSCRMA
jgi:elongation factor P